MDIKDKIKELKILILEYKEKLLTYGGMKYFADMTSQTQQGKDFIIETAKEIRIIETRIEEIIDSLKG